MQQAAALRSRVLSIALALSLLALVLSGAIWPSLDNQSATIDLRMGMVRTQAQSTSSYAVESEFRWLKSTQRPDGAITHDASRERVIPYFSNLAALQLLQRDPGAVRLYMEWYLDRLNMPDRFGLYGTIYDRYYVNGIEKSTEDYDSADSYAATFLTLAWQYQVHTGDTEWITKNLERLDTVAGVVISLQDSDGLVWAKPNHKMKYLMDNSENYRGLMDWANALEIAGNSELSQHYRQRANMVKEGIEQRLWDRRRQKYLWGIGPVIMRAPRSRVWYPDNVSQMYPVVFGVIPEDSERARHLYAELNRAFPRWQEYAKGDPYPWAIMAYAAARMGDTQRVSRFIEVTESRFIKSGRPSPWYSMESAFYLLASQRLDKLLEAHR